MVETPSALPVEEKGILDFLGNRVTCIEASSVADPINLKMTLVEGKPGYSGFDITVKNTTKANIRDIELWVSGFSEDGKRQYDLYDKRPTTNISLTKDIRAGQSGRVVHTAWQNCSIDTFILEAIVITFSDMTRVSYPIDYVYSSNTMRWGDYSDYTSSTATHNSIGDAIGSIQKRIETSFSQEDPLIIFRLETVGPNSAGGVGMSFTYVNLSPKTIKYLWLKVTPYNAVDDKQACDITRDSTKRLKITGPIEYGEKDYASWSAIWYNYSIQKFVLESVEIEYMDGTKITLP